MKITQLRPLLISILIFTVSSFLVHLLLNPESTLLNALGYGAFAGILAGVVFYFIDRNKTH